MDKDTKEYLKQQRIKDRETLNCLKRIYGDDLLSVLDKLSYTELILIARFIVDVE